MKKPQHTKLGMFDWDTLTVKFGGEKSIPENIFTATAIKVPAYKYYVRENEDLGGGWHGGRVTNEYTADNMFIIIRDGVCIGWMQPYAKVHNIKSELYPIDTHTHNQILSFIKEQGY